MRTSRGWALIRASHPEPGLAVTTLAVLLALAMGAEAHVTAWLAAAALTGQLSVGWSNDLIDVERDRAAGRGDKPLATGTLRPGPVRVSVLLALLTTCVSSLAVGLRPGLLHLGLVALGWTYNAWLKRTVLSWVPYAVCFGMLPVVVSLAASGETAPGWMPVAGALLGVGAHLVNAVPDLADDERTGVRGLPHALGTRRSVDVATVLMVVGSIVTVLGPRGPVGVSGVATLVLVVALAVVGRTGRASTGFRAALAIALVDVMALLIRS